MPHHQRRPTKERRRTPLRGRTGKTGPRGPKGEPGKWPAAAYDALEQEISRLRTDLDDLRATMAEIQEAIPISRFEGRYRPSTAPTSKRKP